MAPSFHPRDAIGGGDPETRSFVIGLACTSAWIAACLAIAASSLPLPNVGFAQDIGAMLDGGWRHYQGLRPHADYHTALGPMYGLIFGLPMVVGGPTYSSLRYLPPIVSALVAIWAWLACWRSLPWLGAAASGIAMGCIAGGIYHIGFQPEALSFACFYNRVGFGILGVVTLAALLPRRALPTAHNRFRDASIVTGILMLLFLKATFFLVSLPLAAAAVALHTRSRRDWLLLSGVAVVVLLYFLAAIGFRLDSMWSDLRMAALARRSAAANYCFPLRNAVANYDFIGLLVLMTLAWFRAGRSRGASAKDLMLQACLLWGPAILGWAVTLVQSHGDGRGLSTALAALAVSAAWFRSRPDAERDHAPAGPHDDSPATTSDAGFLPEVVLLMACALFVLPHAQSYAQWYSVSRQPGPPQFRVAPLRELYLGSFVNVMGPECVAKMNDAIDLLQRHCKVGDSLQYIDDNNPYGFACGLRTPKKSNMFWETGSSYSRESHPPASDFDDTDFILVPKPALKYVPLQLLWREIYGYYIGTHFTTCEETDYFILYRRNSRA